MVCKAEGCVQQVEDGGGKLGGKHLAMRHCDGLWMGELACQSEGILGGSECSKGVIIQGHLQGVDPTCSPGDETVLEIYQSKKLHECSDQDWPWKVLHHMDLTREWGDSAWRNMVIQEVNAGTAKLGHIFLGE